MTELNAEAERTKNYAQAAALYFGERTREPARASRAQDRALDGSASDACWHFSFCCSHRRHSAWHCGVPARAARPLYFVRGRRRSDDSRLGALGVAGARAGARHQSGHCDRRPFSLQPLAYHPEHCRRSAGHSPATARSRRGPRPWTKRAASKDFSADRVTHNSRRDQNQRSHQCWLSHPGRLIGAGGLGEPIISGLNLNDHATILQGAIPAAALALLVQLGFGPLDLLVIPRGLRCARTVRSN